VCLPFLFLLLFTLLGCAPTKLFLGKLDAAEDEIARGKPYGYDLAHKPALLPPSYDARHRLALIVESVLLGAYSYPEVRKDLEGIREDPHLPKYLRVEAGYLLVLFDELQRTRREVQHLSEEMKKCSDHSEKAQKTIEELKKHIEEKHKELEVLTFKLNKLEEIHLDTEKRRGTQ